MLAIVEKVYNKAYAHSGINELILGELVDFILRAWCRHDGGVMGQKLLSAAHFLMAPGGYVGGFVSFRCGNCRYEEHDLGVGRGREEMPFLSLFRCDNCHSVGSTWIFADRVPRCTLCYHDAVTLLPEDVSRLPCPKCGEPAGFERLEGEWR